MSNHLATASFDDIVTPRTGEQPTIPAPATRGSTSAEGAPSRRSISAEGAPSRRSSSTEGAYRDPAEPIDPVAEPARPVTRVFGIELTFRRGGSGAAPKSAATDLALGAEPRVDLLPPEVKARRATRVLQRRLFAAVIVVAVLVAAACGGAWFLRHQATQQLAAEQSRTSSLVAEQLRYSKVSKLEQQTQFVQTAQHVAGATDVDWQAYLDKVQASLPAGVTISTLKVDAETPLVAYAQPQTPLQGPRVATITFTAMSSQLPDVPVWLDALKKLPGYADANPDTVNRSGAQYSATITMHVNADVFDNRFAQKDSK